MPLQQQVNRAASVILAKPGGERGRWDRPSVSRFRIDGAEGPLGPLGDGFGGQDIVS